MNQVDFFSFLPLHRRGNFLLVSKKSNYEIMMEPFVQPNFSCTLSIYHMTLITLASIVNFIQIICILKKNSRRIEKNFSLPRLHFYITSTLLRHFNWVRRKKISTGHQQMDDHIWYSFYMYGIWHGINDHIVFMPNCGDYWTFR